MMLKLRFRSLFRRERVEQELDDELRFHFEKQVEENLAAGMGEKSARIAARRQFGDVAQRTEECRDARRVSVIQDLWQDLRYAARMLRKSPGFTAVAVSSLALGIGANTAIFTLINVLLLRTLPVPHPEQLVMLNRSNLEGSDMTGFPYPFYRELRDHNSSFQGVICVAGMGPSLSIGGSSEQILGELVSGNYFEVLGVKPYIGRFFSNADDRAVGQGRVVVLSYNFWKSRFGRDPGIVGKAIHLNTIPMSVIGVSPAGFDGMQPGSTPDLRVPITMEQQMRAGKKMVLEDKGDWWLNIFGRLKPGISPVKAQAEIQPVLMNLLAQDKITTVYGQKLRTSERILVGPAARGDQDKVRQFEMAFKVLMAITAAVLLIACLNLSNLLLARTVSRGHEMAVRLALGARRGRLARQLATESILLALLGGTCAIGVAYAGSRLLLSMVQDRATFDLTPDLRVLGFTFALSLLTGLLMGLAPVLQSRRSSVHDSLKQRSGRATGERLMVRRFMTGAQVALSLVLLSTAFLFAASLRNLRTMDTGFKRQNVFVMAVDPQYSGLDEVRMRSFYREVLDRVHGLPGIVSASYSHVGLIDHSMWGSGITVEGYTPKEGDPGPLRDAVGPGFFHTVGMPVLLGREFGVQDNQGSPHVAIVNESFARFYFGNGNPLGRHIGPAGNDRPTDYEIVGVVKDGKYSSLREKAQRFWYIPYEQNTSVAGLALFVRTVNRPEDMFGTLRQAMGAVNANVPVSRMKTVEVLVEDDLSTERLLAKLSIFFFSACWPQRWHPSDSMACWLTQ